MMEGEHTRPRVLRSAPSRSAGATRQTGADFRKATRQNTEIPVSGEGAGNNTRGRVAPPTYHRCLALSDGDFAFRFAP